MNYSSDFPSVGDGVLGYVGSGKPPKNSRYMKSVSKQTMGRGKSPTGSNVSRHNVKLSEGNGPKCHVVSTLYKANAADAGLQTRNVRIMPSCCGVSDFQKARNAAGSVY